MSVPMAMEINGATYYPADYVAREARVTRQTLWRWRREGRIPAGRRYRDRQVLFTAAELALVRAYAQRVVPIDGPTVGETR